MPKPDANRDRTLKYLRSEFPHKADLVLGGRTYPYEDVRHALYSIKDTDPQLLKIFNYYAFSALSRTRIADEVGFDASTIKRRLNIVADLVMQKLNHSDLFPADLFENRHPVTGVNHPSSFPRINWRKD